ncbi:hypothetical protein LSCM1_03399 [Leishmania martiniquensis]|uniref:RING-type domain-containing protein n=1 Tax=Leishmania martiniquensis TaxID=1580590 RepID=A0A836HCN0_9TRYP|nr:hypothetical protein LSCM1_03399 [Leishmania martiniquensis]
MCADQDRAARLGSAPASQLPEVTLEAAERRSLAPSAGAAISGATAADSTALYENICGICFTDVHPVDNPRGRLNSCGHLFCSYCIKAWARNTNVCPCCKARFTRIYTVHADSGKEEETKVRKRNYIAWETSYYDDDAASEEALRNSVVCDVCQQPHNAARIIFCDRRQCTFAAHLECLSLEERPVTFLCVTCTKLRDKEEDEHAPLADSFSVAALAAAAPQPPSLPTPATVGPESAVAPAPALRRATACTATKSAKVVQTRDAVVPVSTRGGARGLEMSERVSSVPAPPPMAASVDRSRAPQVTSHMTVDRHGNSQRFSSSSSSAMDPASVLRASSATPRVPVDFSKPHVDLMTQAMTASRRCSRYPPSAPHTMAATEVDDDYYFLAPTSHTVAARIEFSRVEQARAAAAAQARLQRKGMKADRLQAVRSVQRSDALLGGTRKRAYRDMADEVTAELELAEEELRNPQKRRLMEERMVREWAAGMLPVLRRRRYVEGDTATTENDLWAQATTQARAMVREKLETKSESLRRRREQLVRAQAQREAAALGKLARIIAQHRERPQRVTQ